MNGVELILVLVASFAAGLAVGMVGVLISWERSSKPVHESCQRMARMLERH